MMPLLTIAGKWLLAKMGISRIAMALAIVGVVLFYSFRLASLEGNIDDLNGRLALLSSQYEAALLRENLAKQALETQNAKIEYHQQEMQLAEEGYRVELERIRAEAANIKPQIVTRWRDNMTCENGMGFIVESQRRLFDGL